MTRILALTNLYAPHSVGGDRSAGDVLERLVARGHQVTVLTSDYRAPDEEMDDDMEPTADVYRRLRLYWRNHDVIVPSWRQRLKMERSNHHELQRAIEHARPEVVCIWTMGAFSLGLIEYLVQLGLPLVYAVCNDWLVWGPDQDAWSSRFAHRPRLARAVGRVCGLPTAPPDVGASGTFLFVSDWTRRLAEEKSQWTFPDSAVVYSGIETRLFPILTSAADEPEGERWTGRLLFVGRLDPDKGAATTVETLSGLPPESSLQLIGPGNAAQVQQLRARATEVGVSGRVQFGVRRRSALAAVYRSADVFLFPSRWEEPFGLTPLEAMACATPVVATALGGSGEYLRDGDNCLTVPRDRPDLMVEAVSRLAQDRSLRRRLVEGGLRTASRFTADALADTFEEWLVAAANGYTGGRPVGRNELETG